MLIKFPSLHTSKSSYLELVRTALAGGTHTAETLEQAKEILANTKQPLVIKLLSEFDGIYKSEFLSFATTAERTGIWVIRDNSLFLEADTGIPNQAD